MNNKNNKLQGEVLLVAMFMLVGALIGYIVAYFAGFPVGISIAIGAVAVFALFIFVNMDH